MKAVGWMKRILTGVVAIALASSVLSAQSTSRVRYSINPYGWLAAFDGRVGVGQVATNVDLGVSDMLDALEFAIMGYGEARVQRYVFGVDAMYVSLGSGGT